jgi:hypothetical protein
MAVLEEAGKAAKHGMRLRGWQATESDGDASQMPFVPNGIKGYMTTTTTTTMTHETYNKS